MERLTMSVPEMARKLGVSRPTAYELVKRQDFPVLKVGRRLLVPKVAFEQWLTTAAISKSEPSEKRKNENE